MALIPHYSRGKIRVLVCKNSPPNRFSTPGFQLFTMPQSRLGTVEKCDW